MIVGFGLTSVLYYKELAVLLLRISQLALFTCSKIENGFRIGSS